MKQYCRYCAYCCYGDVFVCEAGDEHIMSESYVTHANHCAHFADCGIDVITGKERRTRAARENQKTADNGSVQLSFFDEV